MVDLRRRLEAALHLNSDTMHPAVADRLPLQCFHDGFEEAGASAPPRLLDASSANNCLARNSKTQADCSPY
jgi:hypothetical protein